MSESTKKVIKALGIFGGSQTIGIICSLIRNKLISIWIGPVAMGLFAIFNSALDMLGPITQLNFRQSAVRTLASSSQADYKRHAGSVRWWGLILGLLGALVMLLASPLLSEISFGGTGWWWAFCALAVAMLLNSVTNGERAIMQGASHLANLAKSIVWGTLVGTALSIPLYYFFGQASIVPSIILFSIAGAVASKLLQTAKVEVPSKLKENIAAGKDMLRLGVYLTIGTLASTAAAYAFISYLNVNGGTATAGIYQAGYTLVIKYVGMVFTAIGMEYYPRLAKVADRPRMASAMVSHEMTVLLCIVSPLAIVLCLTSGLAIRIMYSEAFLDALPIVAIGAGGAVFRAISYCMSYVIVARGDGKAFILTDVASAAIGLTLNIVCYNWLGLSGLGIAYVLQFAIYSVMVWCVYRFRYGMRLSLSAVAIAGSSVLLVISVCMLRMLYEM